jgi:DMSO/TMAO reductase YedYZ molybdopterin-dependent catalytic subunit
MSILFPRRRILQAAWAGAGSLLLSGCDRIAGNESVNSVLRMAESITMGAQRAIISDKTLAREFTEADLSPVFRANGTTMPTSEEYSKLEDGKFADWRLVVDGKVRQPLSLSLDDLKRLPSRTQITRHDCVEGWSAIGKWTGVPLGLILQTAGVATDARYAVFHCADDLEETDDGSGVYYESIDLFDAFHLQTILAYTLNGEPLPVANGAPLRLRVERHLGYKHAKYIMRIELVDSFATFGQGRGGYWEDRGYEWYAGI